MDTNALFGLQFAMSLGLWAYLAGAYIAPWLAQKPVREGLSLLLLPHTFRHIGLSFLVPGVVAAPLPPAFAVPAAFGDLAAALLAVLALVAVRREWRGALAFVGVFSAVGSVDLVYALGRGFSVGAQAEMGATWFIPTFLVPALLVSHALIWRELWAAGLGRSRAFGTT